MKVLCAADIHSPTVWNEHRWNIFTGSVIAADEKVRETSNGKRVFNVVLEDSTGIVSLGAWNAHADQLALLLNQLESANDATWLRLEVFSIYQLKNSPKELCPIGALQTIPANKDKRNQVTPSAALDDDLVDGTFGTAFRLVKASEANTPECAGGFLPSLRNSLDGVSYFDALADLHPPFRINISGIVAEISDLQPSLSGSGKNVRTIVLSDPNGAQVSIKQLGCGAEDLELQQQQHIVMFFVSGVAAYKPGEAGSLWAYDDSLLKIASMANSVPVRVKEVSILGV